MKKENKKQTNEEKGKEDNNCGFNSYFGRVTVTTLSSFIISSTAQANRGPCPPYPSLETCLGWNQGQT